MVLHISGIVDRLEEALAKTNPRDFRGFFGGPKPESDTPIIFTCRTGRRAAQAVDIADKLGFTKYIILLNCKINLEVLEAQK